MDQVKSLLGQRRLLARSRHTNEHRECLLSGTLRKSRFIVVRAVVDPNRKPDTRVRKQLVKNARHGSKLLSGIGTSRVLAWRAACWKGPLGLSPALELGKTRALALLGYFKKAL